MVERRALLVFWVVIAAVVTVPMLTQRCLCLGEEDVDDKTNTWSGWAYDTLTQGMGMKQGDDADGKGEINTVIHEASEKFGDAKNLASENTHEAVKIGKDKAADAFGGTRQRLRVTAHNLEQDEADDMDEKVIDTMAKGYNEAKDKIESATETVSNKASDAMENSGYEEAKKKAGDAYTEVKETVTDKAKDTYEAAKEAAGAVGDSMRKPSAEL